VKITINIETNEPADIERIATALTGGTATVKTTKAAAPAAAAANTAPAAAAANTPAAAAPAVPSDKQIMDAVNPAVAKLGAGGQEKLKGWIAANYKTKDGAPAGLKSVADDQKADMVAKFALIAAGTLTI